MEEGDPLVVQKNGKWVLEGIGIDDPVCDLEQYPSIYARIANPNILHFIKITTGIN